MLSLKRLKSGDHFRSLAKKPLASFDDLLTKANGYANLEEVQRMKNRDDNGPGSNLNGAGLNPVKWVSSGFGPDQMGPKQVRGG